MAYTFDQVADLAISAVLSAPDPPDSGTSLGVTVGQGAWFPAPPFDLIAWPAASTPTPANAKRLRVTAVSGDLLRLDRSKDALNLARPVHVGDQVMAPLTSAAIVAIQDAINAEQARALTAEALAAQKAANLSDLASAPTARTSLGLGSSATHASTDFDPAGAAAAAQAASDPLGTAATAAALALQKASNLSDLGSPAAARTNLGLGTVATHATGDFDAAGAAAAAQAASDPAGTAATAAALALQKASNLSDLGSASSARTNLGLGSSATHASSDFDAAGAAAAAQAAADAYADSAVGVERSRATAAEATLATGAALTAETSRATAAEALLAPKASPALTGTPTAPTPSAGDNATHLATTAYADRAVGTETSRATAAEATLATSTALTAETSRASAAEALLAPKASPALTGTPTAPTPAANDNSTHLATTQYADRAVATETTRASAAEALLATTTALTAETSRATAAESLALQAANNLSDLADAGTARFNLGDPTLPAAEAVGTANVASIHSGTLPTIDGYAVQENDLILLTAQTTSADRGLWIAHASSAWARPTVFAAGTVQSAKSISVINGTTYAGSIWLLKTATSVTVDASSQTWAQQNAAGGSLTNPMTGVGDMLIGASSGTPARLAPGTNGTLLSMVSGSPAWASATGATGTGPGSSLHANATGTVQLPDASTFGNGAYTCVLTGNVQFLAPTAVLGASFTLVADEDKTGGRTVGFNASGPMVFFDGDAPRITTVPYGRNVWFWQCVDGSSWRVSVPSAFSLLDRYRISASHSNFGLGHAAGSLAAGATTVTMASCGTLSGTLGTGSPITTLALNSLSQTLTAPAQVMLNDGAGHTQTFTLSATSSPSTGATSLAVVSQTPTFAFPSGTTTVTPTHDYAAGHGIMAAPGGSASGLPTISPAPNATYGGGTGGNNVTLNINSGATLVTGVTYFVSGTGLSSLPPTQLTATSSSSGTLSSAVTGAHTGTVTLTRIMGPGMLTAAAIGAANDTGVTRQYAVSKVLSSNGSEIVTAIGTAASVTANSVLAVGHGVAVTLTVSAGATGTFKLKVGSTAVTGTISVTASASTVQSALEPLAGVGVGNVVCSGGPLGTSPVQIVYTGILSGPSPSSGPVTSLNTKPSTGTVTVAVAPPPQVQVQIPAANLTAGEAYAVYGDCGAGGAMTTWPLLGLMWYPNIGGVNKNPGTVPGHTSANPAWGIGPYLAPGSGSGSGAMYGLTGVDLASNETPLQTNTTAIASVANEGNAITWSMFTVNKQLNLAFEYLNIWRSDDGGTTWRFMACVPPFDGQWADYGFVNPGLMGTGNPGTGPGTVVGTLNAPIAANATITQIPAYTTTPIANGMTVTVTDGVNSDSFTVYSPNGNGAINGGYFATTNVSTPAFANAIGVYGAASAHSYAAGSTSVIVTQAPPAALSWCDAGLVTTPVTATLNGTAVTNISPALPAGATYPIQDLGPLLGTASQPNGVSGVSLNGTISGSTFTLATATFAGSSGTCSITGPNITGTASLAITSTTQGTLTGTFTTQGLSKAYRLFAEMPATPTFLTVAAGGLTGTLSQAALAPLPGISLTIPGIPGKPGCPVHVPNVGPQVCQGVPYTSSVASVQSPTQFTLKDGISVALAAPVFHHDDTDALTSAVSAEGTIDRLPAGLYSLGFGNSNGALALANGQSIRGVTGPASTRSFQLSAMANALPDTPSAPTRTTLVCRSLSKSPVQLDTGARVSNLQYYWPRQANGFTPNGHDVLARLTVFNPPTLYVTNPGAEATDCTDINSYIVANWQSGTSKFTNWTMHPLRYGIVTSAGEAEVGAIRGDPSTTYSGAMSVVGKFPAIVKGQANLTSLYDIHCDGIILAHLTHTDTNPGVDFDLGWNDDCGGSLIIDEPVSPIWLNGASPCQNIIRGLRATAGGGMCAVISSGMSPVGSTVKFLGCHFANGLVNQGSHTVHFVATHGAPGTLIPAVTGSTAQTTVDPVSSAVPVSTFTSGSPGTLTVASTSGFAAVAGSVKGRLTVATTLGLATLTYTGLTATTFTGVVFTAGAAGVLSSLAGQNSVAAQSTATLRVSTDGFDNGSAIVVPGSAAPGAAVKLVRGGIATGAGATPSDAITQMYSGILTTTLSGGATVTSLAVSGGLAFPITAGSPVTVNDVPSGHKETFTATAFAPAGATSISVVSHVVTSGNLVAANNPVITGTVQSTLYVLDTLRRTPQSFSITSPGAGATTVGWLDLPAPPFGTSGGPAYCYVISASGTGVSATDTWAINGIALLTTSQSWAGGRFGAAVGEGVQAAPDVPPLYFQVPSAAAGTVMSVPVTLTSAAGGAGTATLNVDFCVSPQPV